MKRTIWFVAVAAILLLSAALRLHKISELSLNNDEIAEVRWSSGTLAELYGEVSRDRVHPPFDYLVQYALSRASVPEWVRRIPAVLAGIFTIACIALLGRWWHSPAAGLFAGLFLAVAPIHVRYSQEVRPYAMAVLFLAAALVFLELYAGTRRRSWAAAWFIAVFLAGATLYLAGLAAVIASVTRILIDRDGGLLPLRRRFPWIVAGWTLLYVPWLHVVLAATRDSPAPPEKLDWVWLEHRLQAFGSGTEWYQPMTIGSWFFWAAAVIGIIASFRFPVLRTATLWLLGGMLATTIILQIRPHYAFVPRYFMPAMLAAPILAGAGIVALWKWPAGRAVSAVTVLVYGGFTAVTLSDYYEAGRPDWRGVAAYVHERTRPGDVVLLTNNWVVRNFGFYWLRLPERRGVRVERFNAQEKELRGPAWVVAAQCRPRAVLDSSYVMWSDKATDLTRVYYIRPGTSLKLAEEVCPE